MTLHVLCNIITMEDSNQSKRRVGEKYKTRTVEETNELLMTCLAKLPLKEKYSLYSTKNFGVKELIHNI